MLEDGQARAYAHADFEEPHSRFVELFAQTFPAGSVKGIMLDLGCGPGDITRRMAKRFPGCAVHGLDGSEAMLKYARELTAKDSSLKNRIGYFCGLLPGARLPRAPYDILISNSLLHHLPEPDILWDSVKKYAGPGSLIFIMDLARPASPREARTLVEKYSPNEPEVLKNDFYHSLLAAYTAGEVKRQLKDFGLDRLAVRTASDRHWTVSGILSA